MAGPHPLFMFFLYSRYRKKFVNDPLNTNKKPKGCLEWYLGFIFKLMIISFSLTMIIFLIKLISG